ncbi:hypothetical protein [Pseudarthrobacter sp. AB1]|uniref:hypothetical protein n=1 Tax=Pseudarthrobacter sp. AB1 TaxID=2138309 RepID=UPI00186B6FCA|nr:hypothetical protein [Pseudarthrobacter sp. AB1]
MTTNPARQPQGIPTGGQFAATTHPEPEVRLAGGGGHLLAHEKYLEEELRLADDPQIIEMEAELPPYTDTSTWEFTRGAQIESERRGIRFESVSGPAAGSAGSRHARTISETRFPWITWHPPENPKGPFPIPSGKGPFCWLQMCLDDGIGQGQHERT